MLDLSLIRIDGGTQSRAKLNNEIVSEYAEAYKAGANFPAVTIFYDGKDRWLADGFHRYHAAKQAGRTTILEKITPGTLRDAKFHAWKANQDHGQRRTNEDKRNIVLEVLADDEAGKWSDNHIAKEFGFSQPFVAGLRASLQTFEVTPPTERTYTTKHGTTATMQTASIGKPATPVAKPAPVVEPEAAEPEDYTELDAANDRASEALRDNEELRNALAVKHMDGTEEEKQQAAALIAEQAAYIKTLEATNRALILSRDSLMEEAVQMKRQMAAQRRENDKLKNNK